MTTPTVEIVGRAVLINGDLRAAARQARLKLVHEEPQVRPTEIRLNPAWNLATTPQRMAGGLPVIFDDEVPVDRVQVCAPDVS